jgi:uncharacterized membrane protein YgcG
MKQFLLCTIACCVSIVTQMAAQNSHNHNHNNQNSGYVAPAEATFELRGADAMLVYVDGYQVNNVPQSRVFVREIPSGYHQIKVRIFRRGQSRVLRTNVNLKRNLRTNYSIGIAPNGNIVLNKLGSRSLQSCGVYNYNTCDGCGGGRCQNQYNHSYNNQYDGSNYTNDGIDTDNCNNWQNDDHDNNYWQNQYDNGHHNHNHNGHDDHDGHNHGGNNGNNANGNNGNGGNGNNGNGGNWGGGGNGGNNGGNGDNWGGNNGNNGNGNNGNWGGNGGNNGNGGGNGQIQTLDVADLCIRMRNASFDTDRITLAQRAVSGNNGITSQDVAMIIKQFDFESNRLEFAKFAYVYTIDKNNYFKIYDSFEYSSSSRALDKFIGK